MASRHLLALVAGLMAMLLAGCTAGSGADASVAFDGEGNGIDSDTADCNDDGTISGTGSITDGEVTVRVMNGANEIFQETYSGDIALDARALDGESGDWMIEATRSGDELLDSFNGEYTFRLDC